jgi:nucleoside transporter
LRVQAAFLAARSGLECGFPSAGAPATRRVASAFPIPFLLAKEQLMASEHPLIRTRLSAMMFLEFFLWASWYVPIGGYMNSALQFTGPQIGWIYTTTALGAIISPLFIGYIADRLFATERVLGVLHLIGAACLFLAAEQTSFSLLMILLVVNALCFMPTLALANSLAFRNIDDPDKFSRIAVFGTIGWIVSGLIVGFVLGDGTKWFFYLAGGGAAAMGLYSFSLPHTPPKGKEEAGGDVLGLRTLRLLIEPSFLVFAISVLLISIPLTFYFTWANAFLIETERPKPTALMTLSQFSEIFVMIVMPWFIVRIGLKNVLLIGMAAWVLRYLCFATLSFPLVIVGLLLHGFCYCFVFVAAFIYADKRVPRDLSASAQSFVAFLMWGVGMFIGATLAGITGEAYPPDRIAAVRQADAGPEDVPAASLPEWPAVEEEETSVDLGHVLGSEGQEEVALVDAAEPVVLLGRVQVLGRLPDEQLKVEKRDDTGELTETMTYARNDLVPAFRRADRDGDGVVTREEWRDARSHDWPPIWLWPCALAAVVGLVFLVGGRDVKSEEEKGEEPPPEAEGEAAGE